MNHSSARRTDIIARATSRQHSQSLVGACEICGRRDYRASLVGVCVPCALD
jgi:hypothetical protein